MLVTNTNLHIYETDVRLYIGDLTEPYTYSTPVVYTALVNAVRYLGNRWGNKYLIFGSGIVASTDGVNYTVNTPDGQCTIPVSTQENDAFRNCYVTFGSVSPPVIEAQDQPALILAAAYLLRRTQASSSYAGLSWSTPDLSYSNIQSGKMLQDLIAQDLAALNAFFAVKLGKMQIGYLKGNFEEVYPLVEQINMYIQLGTKNKF